MLQVASWALDGISYIATGKSVTDHGISAVTQRDCALLRGFTEGQVCRDADVESPVQVASADPIEPVIDAQADIFHAPVEAVVIVPADDQTAALELAALETATGAPEALVSVAPLASVEPASIPTAIIMEQPSSGLFFVVASFKERIRAEVALTKHNTLDAQILTADVDGKVQYRLAVGPFPREELASVREGLKVQGFTDAWAVHMDILQTPAIPVKSQSAQSAEGEPMTPGSIAG